MAGSATLPPSTRVAPLADLAKMPVRSFQASVAAPRCGPSLPSLNVAHLARLLPISIRKITYSNQALRQLSTAAAILLEIRDAYCRAIASITIGIIYRMPALSLAAMRKGGSRHRKFAVADEPGRAWVTRHTRRSAAGCSNSDSCPGEAVEVIEEIWPGRDPIAVRVGNSTFALRRREARAVMVDAERPAAR